jgi:glycosyltransferase involved in cell wall biosynthesis
MRVWLITVGEPLPLDGSSERLLRTGILAELLVQKGHEVVWWTSSFHHVRKRQRSVRNTRVSVGERYDLQLLYGPSYSGNVSLRRILNHKSVAKNFRKLAPTQQVPDVILCSWPLIELCVEAVNFGKSVGVPVVLDVRDMWPDAITDIAPRSLQPVAKWLLQGAYADARMAATRATAITGITDPIVDWAVQFADRVPTPLEQSFPMGYKFKSTSVSEMEDAYWRWATRGVSPDDSNFIACFFGTLGRHFELETVVAAARQLDACGRRIKFVICGDGPELPRWKKAAETCNSIVIPGWVDAVEIQSLMAMSSVGLAPYHSTWDFMISIPNKPIEYLSAGLPVVSSLQGTLAKLLEESNTGITYANGDSGGLATVLSSCYDRPSELDRMSSNATRLYQQRFVAESVYSKMADYLLGIADSNGLRRAA